MFPYAVALMYVCNPFLSLLYVPKCLTYRPEILHMSELNDSPDLQAYSSAILYVVSAVTPPAEDVEVILNHFMDAIKSSSVRSCF